MSDTKKNRDAAAREARAPRGGLGEAEDIAQQAVEELHGVGEAVAETVVRTADAAVEMGQRVAEQGQEVMLLGVRTAAGMNGRMADAGMAAATACWGPRHARWTSGGRPATARRKTCRHCSPRI